MNSTHMFYLLNDTQETQWRNISCISPDLKWSLSNFQVIAIIWLFSFLSASPWAHFTKVLQPKNFPKIMWNHFHFLINLPKTLFPGAPITTAFPSSHLWRDDQCPKEIPKKEEAFRHTSKRWKSWKSPQTTLWMYGISRTPEISLKIPPEDFSLDKDILNICKAIC